MWHATDLETDLRARSCGRSSISHTCARTPRSCASLASPLVFVGATQAVGAAGNEGTARHEPQIIEVRPNGLARGKYSWPAWAIGVVGFALVLIALTVWVIRVRDRRKR